MFVDLAVYLDVGWSLDGRELEFPVCGKLGGDRTIGLFDLLRLGRRGLAGFGDMSRTAGMPWLGLGGGGENAGNDHEEGDEKGLTIL